LTKQLDPRQIDELGDLLASKCRRGATVEALALWDDQPLDTKVAVLRVIEDPVKSSNIVLYAMSLMQAPRKCQTCHHRLLCGKFQEVLGVKLGKRLNHGLVCVGACPSPHNQYCLQQKLHQEYKDSIGARALAQVQHHEPDSEFQQLIHIAQEREMEVSTVH
jgi:hypothetical protein